MGRSPVEKLKALSCLSMPRRERFEASERISLS